MATSTHCGLTSRPGSGRRFGGVALLCALGAACMLLSLPPSARAASLRDYPAFVEINAIAALQAGGFVVAGRVRTESSPPDRSGLLYLSDNGEPHGEVVELLSPKGDHPTVVARALARLPGDDLIVGGWVAGNDANPDAWLCRVTASGTIVWNKVYESDLQEKIYTVGLVGSGRALAVGRSQLGDKDEPARGLARWIDVETGDVVGGEAGFACDKGSTRCAFQDFTELDDGSLIFAGWKTKADKTDDIWLLKTDANGAPVSSISFGEVGNDVAFAVASLDDAVAAGGSQNKGKAKAPAVTRLGTGLDGRSQVDLPEAKLGSIQSIEALPDAKTFLIAGTAAAQATAKPSAFLALLRDDKPAERVADSTLPTGPSVFTGIAISAEGTIALAGSAGSGSDERGIVWFGALENLCPATPPNEQAAIYETTRDRIVCATKQTPSRLKISVDTPRSAVIVQPLLGDIDALVLRGDAVVDSSFGRDFATELLVLPADVTDVELQIPSTTSLAMFSVRVTEIVDPPSESEEAGADGDEGIDAARFVDFALRSLGFDVAADSKAVGTRSVSYNRRAVLAFEASEGLALDGVLSKQERATLLARAARRIEAAAARAAKKGTDAAKSAPPAIALEEGYFVRSMSAGLNEGGWYGQGEFEDNSTYSGLWSGDLKQTPTPVLGVWKVSGHCTILLGAVDGLQSAWSLDDLFAISVGVVRWDNEIVHAGGLSHVDRKNPCGSA